MKKNVFLFSLALIAAFTLTTIISCTDDDNDDDREHQSVLLLVIFGISLLADLLPYLLAWPLLGLLAGCRSFLLSGTRWSRSPEGAHGHPSAGTKRTTDHTPQREEVG